MKSIFVGISMLSVVLVSGAALSRAGAPGPVNPYYKAVTLAHRENLDEITDQFAASPEYSRLLGAPFRLQLTPEEDIANDFKTASFYYYEDGKLTLNFFSRADHRYIVRVRTLPFGKYIGQNGFGAKVRVSKLHVITDGLISVGGDDTYEWSQPLSGPAARMLSRDIQVIVEGRLAKLTNGNLTSCSANAISATFTKPHDVLEDSCDVGASLSRVAFVRRSTGAVLKEWRINS